MFTFIYTDGSISSHNTLEGMVEMLLNEILEEEDYDRMSKSYKNDNWSEKEMIDFITMFDVEVIKNTEE